MKVAIVVGHSSESRGAVAVDGVQEWTWHDVLARQVVDELGGEGVDAQLYHRPTGSYSRAMAKLTREINTWSPDFVVELHFNSFEGPIVVQGSCALHYPGSVAGRKWAALLSATVATAQGIRDRGAREQAVSWSGAVLYILRDTLAPAVILETHYGDDPEDHRRATAARDDGSTARALARAIARGVA